MKNFLPNQQNQSIVENQEEDDKWVNEFINESLAPNQINEEENKQEDFWKDFQYEWTSAETEL